MLFSLGILPKEKFINLRRLAGTFGHPDIRTPGIEANSGSLGMGISKAKGMAAAKVLLGRSGRIFVMTGDGELQEGQIYEALQTAAHQKITNLNVIVDHNKVQSDRPVADILTWAIWRLSSAPLVGMSRGATDMILDNWKRCWRNSNTLRISRKY